MPAPARLLPWQRQYLARLDQALALAGEWLGRPVPLAAAPVAPAAQLVPARLLDIDHLGCWVVVDGDRNSGRDFIQQTHGVHYKAGRLVGYEPGTLGRGSQSPTRILVLLQGPRLVEVETKLDTPVRVAPREWN